MAVALEEAKKAWGDTHPNPMVGAVIVENNEIVAKGFHQAAGQPHAEVEAFQNLGRKPKANAILYVTLEPCCMDGQTPPCTRTILDSGIQSIRVGTKDPNPLVSGTGLTILREAGIKVKEGVLKDECREINLIFNHWITRNSPLLAGKVATTIDGRIATSSGDSKWITSGRAREDVMRWRRLFPAIAVGANTVLQDNPHLTSRQTGREAWCPLRLVFDSKLQTWSKDRSVYSDSFRDRTTIITVEDADNRNIGKMEEQGIQLWKLPNRNGRPCLKSFRKKCIEKEITGVFIEGGSLLLSAFLNTANLDYLFAYRAPKILGDSTALPVFQGRETVAINEALALSDTRHATFGADQLLRGYISHP